MSLGGRNALRSTLRFLVAPHGVEAVHFLVVAIPEFSGFVGRDEAHGALEAAFVEDDLGFGLPGRGGGFGELADEGEHSNPGGIGGRVGGGCFIEAELAVGGLHFGTLADEDRVGTVLREFSRREDLFLCCSGSGFGGLCSVCSLTEVVRVSGIWDGLVSADQVVRAGVWAAAGLRYQESSFRFTK